MKAPDLTIVEDAGVRAWTGSIEPLRSGCGSTPHLAFSIVDLAHAKDRTALFAALDKSLALPDHFGHNWDALADVLEDRDWLGKRGRVIAFTGSAAYRREHPTDWSTLEDILGEAAEFWKERTSRSGSSLRNPRSTPSLQVPRYKIPVSTLVVVYTPVLDVLLIERADYPEHWQSVTGSQEPGETLAQTATRELREETGIDADAYGGVVDWHMRNVFEIFSNGRAAIRPVPRTTPSTCSGSRARTRARDARAARAPAARVAAVARGGGPLLFMDQPRGDRGTACVRDAAHIEDNA